jgi:predicted dehydrogenase
LGKEDNVGKVRAGVIGAGFIGPVHIEALQRIGIPVVALCDSNPARAEEIAAHWNIPTIYSGDDYEKMIQSDEVDVVHIASPNRMHFDMARAALAAGKHCICEKPLAMDSGESRLLADLSRGSDTVFAVNYNVRFYPALLQMRAMVQRGDLGQIIHVNGSYMQDWLLLKTDYNWRLLPGEGGKLRAVADIGTHWMDAVSFILGSPVHSVLGLLETFHKKRLRPLGEIQTFSDSGGESQEFAEYLVQTEDFASVLLRFGNGVLGNLAVSQVAAGRKNCIRIEMYGSEQSAWWNSEEPDYLHIGHRDGGNITSFRASSGFQQDIQGFTDYPAGHVEGFPDTFKMFARAVYSDIKEGPSERPLYATAFCGHWEVCVCEAILASQQKRSWVDVVG